MRISQISLAAVAGALLSSPTLAATADGCAPMNRLIQQARNDFPSLRSLKMQPGVCKLRADEFKCGWAFPGDAFGVAETQTAALVQCAAAKTGSLPQKLKRGDTAIELESDLSLIVGAPKIEDGRWLVTLRIVAEPATKP